MKLQHDGGYWLIINDAGQEAGRLEVGLGYTEVIVATYENYQMQGGYRAYDYLVGVHYGLMHATLLGGLPAYQPPGDENDTRPDIPGRSSEEDVPDDGS